MYIMYTTFNSVVCVCVCCQAILRSIMNGEVLISFENGYVGFYYINLETPYSAVAVGTMHMTDLSEIVYL